MERRPNDSNQKNPTIDSIPFNETTLQETPKNHFLEKSCKKCQKKPRIRKIEIGSELWWRESPKVMGSPLRSVNQVLSRGGEGCDSIGKDQTKRDVSRFR